MRNPRRVRPARYCSIFVALAVAGLTVPVLAQDPARFHGAQVVSTAELYATDVSIDFDGDGLQDAFGVFDALFENNNVVALFNRGSEGFVQGLDSISFFSGLIFESQVFVDVDGAGSPELLFLENTFARNVVVLSSDAVGALTILDQFQPASFQAFRLATGDLDADGDADLVISTLGTTFEVWLNGGQGVFGFVAAYVLPGGLFAQPLPLLDLDGDGLLEIVAPASGSDAVWIFPAAPGGAYGTPTTLPLTFTPGTTTLVGDFDGDGADDLFLAGVAGSDTGAVLFADGAGGLVQGPLQFIPAGSLRARDRHAALVEDGDLDLLVLTDELERPDRLHVFENDGAGIFSVDAFGPIDLDDDDLGLRDMDGDGLEDIAHCQPALFALPLTFLVSVRRGRADGSFELYPFVDVAGEGETWRLSSVADVDGDGVRELIGGTDAGDLVLVRELRPGVSPSVERIAVSPGEDLDVIALADFNGDCVTDLAVRDGGACLFVFLGAGDGSFTLAFQRTFELQILSALRFLSVADFDRDGTLDLLTEARQNTVRGIAILFGDGAGGFPLETFWMTGLDAPFGESTVRDLNRDGWPDLVLLSDGYYPNDGAGGLLPFVDLGVSAKAIVDFDLDGDLDFFDWQTSILQDDELTWHRNLGDLTFQSIDSSVPTKIQAVALGDFDADGVLDAYVECDSPSPSEEQDRDALYLGSASGLFSAVEPTYASTLGAFSTSLQAADLDQDGSLDLIKANEVGFSVHWNLSPAEDDVCQPDLGFDGPGDAVLSACGERLELGGQTTLEVRGAAPNRKVFFLGSSTFAPTCILGLNVVPVPLEVLLVFPSDAVGRVVLPPVTSVGGPFSFYVQAAYLDPLLTGRIGLTNAVRLDFLP